MLTTVLTILNTLILLTICVVYFIKNYIIVERSLWDAICTTLEEEKEKVENLEQPEELAGGNGFFREYVEDEEYEDE